MVKSIDAGLTWALLNQGFTSTSAWSLAVDSISPAVYVGTDGAGAFRSSDRGANWIDANTGLLNVGVFSLEVDPVTPSTVYAGTDGGGVFKSTNGGASWSAANSGMGNRVVFAIVIDPTTPATIYAGTNSGVFKSSNAGGNWSAANSGLPNSQISTLAINPAAPATLYAGTFTTVFKTTNGGASWTAANSGLPSSDVRAFAIDPTAPATVYAGTVEGNIFKTTDAGSNWSLLIANPGVAVLALAIDPSSPSTVYAGLYGGRVTKSTDGDITWVHADSGLTNLFVRAIRIDPSAPGTLYVATDGGGVFKSINGGARWRPTETNPMVPDGGVVNNASYAPSPAPVAPGSIVAIFGNNLNDFSLVLSSALGSDGKVVKTLGGASVKINDIDAPLFYSTSGQLGVQIPFELAGQSSATMQVTTDGITSAPTNLFLDALAPGLFTVNQAGTGLVAALYENGVTPITEQNPARRNEAIVLFGTGLGVTNPPLTTGQLSAGNRTATATVMVDGAQAVVDFSGTAPGFAGLNQINIRIPSGTRFASNIPMVLSIGGKQSNTVAIPVGP